jgi:hypothetical protein
MVIDVNSMVDKKWYLMLIGTGKNVEIDVLLVH